MESLIYKIINNKIENMKQVDNTNTFEDINSNIVKFLKQYKVSDIKNINLDNPTEKDMIFYLIYLLELQKINDLEALNNIQKIIDFKIDVHNGTLCKEEIDSLINLYRVQIKLD